MKKGELQKAGYIYILLSIDSGAVNTPSTPRHTLEKKTGGHNTTVTWMYWVYLYYNKSIQTKGVAKVPPHSNRPIRPKQRTTQIR